MKSINNGKKWEENDIPREDHQDFQVSEATTKLNNYVDNVYHL